MLNSCCRSRPDRPRGTSTKGQNPQRPWRTLPNCGAPPAPPIGSRVPPPAPNPSGGATAGFGALSGGGATSPAGHAPPQLQSSPPKHPPSSSPPHEPVIRAAALLLFRPPCVPDDANVPPSGACGGGGVKIIPIRHSKSQDGGCVEDSVGLSK